MQDNTRVAECWTSVQAKWHRASARWLSRRPLKINSSEPLVSFTFDDFPRSALSTGGTILEHFGFAGTYYSSLGLLGRHGDCGPMFTVEDLNAVLRQGHELGCHTFDHCHSWRTKPSLFEASIIANSLALKELLPGAVFKTFSYPICAPRMLTKRRMRHHFVCCRGGRQTVAHGTVDLDYVSAYFLEKSRHQIAEVKAVIHQNRQARG